MGRSTGYWEVSYEMYSTLASGGAFHIVTPTWESLEVFGSCDITTLHRIIISIELVNACGGYGMTVPRWPCLLLCMERQVKVPCGARITEIPSPHVVHFHFAGRNRAAPLLWPCRRLIVTLKSVTPPLSFSEPIGSRALTFSHSFSPSQPIGLSNSSHHHTNNFLLRKPFKSPDHRYVCTFFFSSPAAPNAQQIPLH
jgi:hypothetical protein